MEFKSKHLGQLVKQEVEAQKKDANWLSKQIDVSPRTIRNMYHEWDIPIERMVKISQALKVDLFVQLLSIENQEILKGILVPPPTKVEAAIHALNEKVIGLERELVELRRAIKN